MMAETSLDSRSSNLIIDLENIKQELSITQKKNLQLSQEIASWKKRAVNAENDLHSEKGKYEATMTRLGLKMLQFENELRKEEREIERKLLEKDKQIKILTEAMGSLQANMKSNTLCLDCFLKKHHAIVGEHVLKEEHYIAKFPLDMDFEDHKSLGPESRMRSLSLPLNLSSHKEKMKMGAEFCYHHKLSPVPEELDSGAFEDSRRVNKQPTIDDQEEQSSMQTSSENFPEFEVEKRTMNSFDTNNISNFEKQTGQNNAFKSLSGYVTIDEEIFNEVNSTVDDIIDKAESCLSSPEYKFPSESSPLHDDGCNGRGRNIKSPQQEVFVSSQGFSDVSQSNLKSDCNSEPCKENTTVWAENEHAIPSQSGILNFSQSSPLIELFAESKRPQEPASDGVETAISKFVQSVIDAAANEMQLSTQENLCISDAVKLENNDDRHMNKECEQGDSNEKHLVCDDNQCLKDLENQQLNEAKEKQYDNYIVDSGQHINIEKCSTILEKESSETIRINRNSEPTEIASRTNEFHQPSETVPLKDDLVQDKQVKESSNVYSDALIEYDVIELD